jgi:hypothetical protein
MAVQAIWFPSEKEAQAFKVGVEWVNDGQIKFSEIITGPQGRAAAVCIDQDGIDGNVIDDYTHCDIWPDSLVNDLRRRIK